MLEVGSMFLSSGDLYHRYRPAACDLRLYLYRLGVESGESSPYEGVIRRLGQHHERAHLATFGNALDLSAGTPAERRQRTLNAIQDGVPVIYQPLFQGTARLSGVDCDLGGAPDFLIRENGGYVIRDVKLSRRINGRDHPEILWQLRLYGRLYELAAGPPPLRLEVFTGTGEIVVVEPLDAPTLDAELSGMAGVIGADAPPFEPVGWSKCGRCGYQVRCWKEAEDTHSVALIPKVDQGMVSALRDAGINSYDELLAQIRCCRPGGVEARVGRTASQDRQRDRHRHSALRPRSSHKHNDPDRAATDSRV